MIKKEDLLLGIEHITKDHPSFLYDVSITTPSNITRGNKGIVNPEFTFDLYKTDWSNFIQNYHLVPIRKDTNYNIKSVIVISSFSTVSFDYFFRDYLLFPVIYHLNLQHNPPYDPNGGFFLWDDYTFDRKQYALRSGAAKLAKPSLVFHEKFGLNCKIELIFSTAEFDDVTTVEDVLYYDNCKGCSAPCEKNCPQNCPMNYELIDWKKCQNFIDVDYLFENPNEMCRICQDSCPYSEELKLKIIKNNQFLGKYLDPKYLHLN